MLQLLKFELYKIYRQKSIYILFALLIGFVSLGLHGDRKEEQEIYQVYRAWEGQITADKLKEIEFLKMEIEQKMDNDQPWSLEDRVLYSISESYSYQNEDRRMQNIAALNAELNNTTSAFVKRNIQLNIDLLTKIDTNEFYYSKGPSNMIDMIYTFGFVITAFMLIIGISPIFSGEYSSGMDQFLLSSKYGRSKVVTAKILSAITFTISVIAGWFALSAAYSIYTYGWQGWSAPLQKIHEHFYAPYPLTLDASYIIIMSMHIIAAIGFTLLVVFVSSICKKGIISLLISGFIFGVPFAIDVAFAGLENTVWINKLLKLSTYQLMKVKSQFIGFDTYNLFGIPILYPIMAVALSLVTAIICWYLTKWVMRRKQVTV
jgi:ABC-type transport system involved in multi-copper enzyme maturation permease subunit